MEVALDGESLTIEDVHAVARDHAKVVVTKKGQEKVTRCRDVIQGMIDSGEAIYGVTTGIGEFSRIRISKEQAEELQRRIVYSHAAGTGKHHKEDEVRAAIQAATLHSDLPIFACMAFDQTQHGFVTTMGVTVEQAVQVMEAAGADVIGTNCSLDPTQMPTRAAPQRSRAASSARRISLRARCTKRLLRESISRKESGSGGRPSATTPQTVSTGVPSGGGRSTGLPLRSWATTSAVEVPRPFTVDHALTEYPRLNPSLSLHRLR